MRTKMSGRVRAEIGQIVHTDTHTDTHTRAAKLVVEIPQSTDGMGCESSFKKSVKPHGRTSVCEEII